MRAPRPPRSPPPRVTCRAVRHVGPAGRAPRRTAGPTTTPFPAERACQGQRRTGKLRRPRPLRHEGRELAGYKGRLLPVRRPTSRSPSMFHGELRYPGPTEGPIRRSREGGSEWEPIKILLDGDRNSNRMNAATNTRLRLTTQVGQAHVATRVPLDLGTNTHSIPTRERSGTPNHESIDPHRSDR
jgi:hypothetical protein